jgi:hypothetical protein
MNEPILILFSHLRRVSQMPFPQFPFLNVYARENVLNSGKGEAIPLQACSAPRGLQEVDASSIPRQSVHEGGKVVSPTHRSLLLPRDIPGSHFC